MSEACSKHTDRGVPNWNITGCIACVMDAYEKKLVQLRAVAEEVIAEHDHCVGAEGPSWSLAEKAKEALRS